MEVLVVGGTGHVGRFLVPRLVEENFSVTVIHRGRTPPPSTSPWRHVRLIRFDVAKNRLDPDALNLHPEVVVDFPGHPRAAVEGFGAQVGHYVVCGSLWMYGRPTIVPTPERFFSRCWAEGYARRFDDLQALFARFEGSQTAVSAVMPPNIAGPGKVPLEGMGGRDPEVHRAHARGEEVVLPEGPESLIGPCDAEDIARLFHLVISNREKSRGKMFNAGSRYALTASQFVQTLAAIHGTKIPIRRVEWNLYKTEVNPDQGSYAHFVDPMCPDISQAVHLLGYDPQYTPEESLERGVRWMKQEGLL